MRRHWYSIDSRLSTTTIIATGVIVRLFHYLHNRSLWLDESLLAMNFVERSYTSLLGPLDYNQKAPAGFLLVVEFLTQTFGNVEYAYRFFPFLCGILSLFLFYLLASRWLDAPGRTLMTGIFALSPLPIYYAAELKEYSSDLLCSLVILWLTDRVLRDPISIRVSTVLALAGAALVWFSFPAAFVLAAAGSALICQAVWRREWPRTLLWAFISALWLTSFSFHYSLTAGHLAEVHWEQTNLAPTFLPIFSLSAWDLTWIYRVLPGEVFQHAAGIHAWLACLFVAIGLLTVNRIDRARGWLMVGPILLVILASTLYLYPIQSRFVLFTVPGTLLLVGMGWEYLWSSLRRDGRTVALLSAALLISQPVYRSSQNLLNPDKEELREALQYVDARQKESDLIYVYGPSEYPFRYYLKRLDRGPKRWVVGVGSFEGSSAADWARYEKELAKLRSNPRVWFLFSHVSKTNEVNEEELILYMLNRLGKQTDQARFPGASAYLYSFSGGPSQD